MMLGLAGIAIFGLAVFASIFRSANEAVEEKADASPSKGDHEDLV